MAGSVTVKVTVPVERSVFSFVFIGLHEECNKRVQRYRIRLVRLDARKDFSGAGEQTHITFTSGYFSPSVHFNLTERR